VIFDVVFAVFRYHATIGTTLCTATASDAARPTVTDVAWSVCVRACVRVCVCVSIMLDTNVSPAKTAEPTEMPFGLWTRVRLSHHLWAGMPQRKGQFWAACQTENMWSESY